MKTRGLLIAVVVLVALGGVLYWSNRHPPADEFAKPAAEAPPKILSLVQADITAIEIRHKDGPAVALAKDSTGEWKLAAPKSLRADQDAVSSLLSSLSSLTAERLIEEKAGDLATYGLANPSTELDVTGKGGKTHKLLIGDSTPAGGGAYAALAGDPRVFSIASYVKSGLDKSSNDLRDKRLLVFDSEKVTRLQLATKKEEIEFGRDKDQWQILNPRPLRADGSQVDEVLRALSGARMDLAGTEEDAKKVASEFAAAARVATVRITTAAGTEQLELRKGKDKSLAKSSEVEGIYKVSGDLAQNLDKKLDDFRNKKLFDFGFADPEKIEMQDGAKAWFLTRSGSDWWMNGKKMDSDSVQSLVDKLRFFSATKFADTGFGAPAIELAVTSNEGNRVEKVSIAKSKDTYTAKREREPALYVLDAKAVEDLQKAATDLKPAPEAKPTLAPKK